MFGSTIKIALRSVFKNRLYALINILGLALGLLIYSFSALLVNYEKNHDSMFDKRDQIYTLASVLAPTSGEPIGIYPDIATAYGPTLKQQAPEIEALARSVHLIRQFTVNKLESSKSFYLGARFVDSDFSKIFNFDYISGNSKVLLNPRQIIVTRRSAIKLFGSTDVVGRSIYLEKNTKLSIGAVIENITPDNHFDSDFRPQYGLSLILPYSVLPKISRHTEQGHYNNVSATTYLLLPKNKSQAWLQQQVNTLYQDNTPSKDREYTEALSVRPLITFNTMVWDSLGFPVLASAQLLGFMILLIVGVNYTNLATAQNLGRTKEVGLRKTLGASRWQLFFQFLLESLSLALFSGLLAMAALEILVPLYNALTGKVVVLDYLITVPKLALLSTALGLLAGVYPAYIISKFKPIESLKGKSRAGQGGADFRSILIAAQFAISIFMLGMVLVIYFQNEKVKQVSSGFAKDSTAVLERLDIDDVAKKQKDLIQELQTIAGVKGVSLSSTVPYRGGQFNRKVSKAPDDEKQSLRIAYVSVDFGFMKNYGIQLLAGRDFEASNSNDIYQAKRPTVHVIINQDAVKKLGYESSAEAIGRRFYQIPKTTESDAASTEQGMQRQYKIVGVMKNSYFSGAHNPIHPMGFMVKPEAYRMASIHIEPDQMTEALMVIDQTWAALIPSDPIQRKSLNDYFQLFYRIPEGINKAVSGFAAIALSLALIGLFGLAAFMTRLRTKEIGIRKVLGASTAQIVRLLVWQISIPIMWSMIIAIPMVYFASSVYLDFFPERIGSVIPYITLATLIGLLSAWAIVAIHAVSIARARPVDSLRYE